MKKARVTFLCAAIVPLVLACLPVSNARACAYSCGQETQTPIAWNADGSQLLVAKEGAFIDCVEEPTDAIPKIVLINSGSGAPVAWHSLDKADNPKKRRVGAHPRVDTDYMDEKMYSVRDTGLLKTHTERAKPMASRRVRVTRSVKDYGEGNDMPCNGTHTSTACEHLTVSVSSGGDWKQVWKGVRSAATDCGDRSGQASDLPSKAIQVWPSPNGKRAAITYWDMGAAQCCYSYGQVLRWVDLPTGSVAAAQMGATHEVYDTSGSDEPWLNLRTRPSMRGKIRAQLSDGTKIKRVGNKGYGKGGWAYKVRVLTGPHTGRVGFAGSRYLRLLSP